MNKLQYSIAAVSLLTLVSAKAMAQESDADSVSAQSFMSKFALSISGGATFSHTDIKPQKTGFILGAGISYDATPYLHLNLDLQKGRIKGGDQPDASGGIGFDNRFFAISLTGRVLPFILIKSSEPAMKVISGIYLGAGVGVITNKLSAKAAATADYGALGDYSGASFMVPLEGGINIPVATFAEGRKVSINLNYRVNFCMSDKIDGYVPVVAANKHNDAYSTLTAGIAYRF